MSKKRTLLLIDADIVAYQAATIAQVSGSWSQDDHNVFGFMQKGKAIEHIERYIQKAKDLSDPKADILMCLTGSNNFRDDISQEYKKNREWTLRPIGLGELKGYIMDTYPSVLEEGLEADDLMGIHATDPQFKPEYKFKVIVSEDKDLKTIPSYVLNPAKDKKPKKISQEEADEFWMAQTIGGDPTDGYSGCPDFGVQTALTFLKEPYKLVPYQHTFKSGKRKGQTETRYKKEPISSTWDAVVGLFEHKGLSEEVALANARMARILRHGDYDFKTKKVKLWKPKSC